MIAAGGAVTQARTALAAMPVKDMESDVSLPQSAAIERVKDRIQDFVRLAIRCAPARATPAMIQATLTARGGAYKGVDVAAFEPGGELDYVAEAVPGRPGWIAVVPTFAIQCGSDAMVMVFARDHRGWQEMISRRSKPYRSIDQGWMGLEYAVSQPDRSGRWYLAVASHTPWCMSIWRGLRYDLSRPGVRGDAAHVFFSKQVGTYLGDTPDSMRATTRMFEIRHDGHSLVIGEARPHIERYAIAGDRVRRIQPAALNPRDFAEEWIVSPWAEAASWSAAGSALKAEHARITAVYWKTGLDFGTIRRCGSGGQEVEVRPDKGAPWYLLVHGTQPFTVRAASTMPSSQCRG